MPVDLAYGRFVRELARFTRTWSIRAEAGPPTQVGDLVTWTVAAQGNGWTVETDVRMLRWDELMDGVGERPLARRLWEAVLALLDFSVSGALAGYIRLAWRYALFFLYPLVLIVALAALSAAIGIAAARAGAPAWASIPLGLLVFAGLIVWGRTALRLNHLLDDWIFSREIIRRPDPRLRAKIEAAARDLIAAEEEGSADEIVVLGHSLGAVLGAEILARALTLKPSLGTGRVKIGFATVGSSIPKIALHRRASGLRHAVGLVGAAPGIVWIDYQARTDVMNFYKVHAVRDLRAGERGPLVRTVPIRKVLDPDYYRRVRTNFLRIHNQFVSANDVRSIYDYFMIACGPCHLGTLARAQGGAEACIRPDGSIETGRVVPFAPLPGLDVEP
ncbi:hypothetical protein [Enterovirga rhinocerotis]|uniref:Lipase (Class 3) n=1 Tax=Enterovirga rhinocerotis TaxID=1339210 RepID=A0A4R7BW83_9HYPH|nr:hypothetical protein [Enterovirga rhinocerotis]TDR90148.1 hypothetical protein EV668_2990 [Enterovirga rhinocerotis]